MLQFNDISLRRGDRLPGFGHPLYPAGDPRARFMLDWLSESYALNFEFELATALASAVA